MKTERHVPIWIWGLILGFALIVLSVQGRTLREETALQQQFAQQPAAPGDTPALAWPQVNIGALPPEVQQTVHDIQNQLQLGQSVPALTPEAQSARLKVTITRVQRRDDQVQIRGQITNISPDTLQVPISAFEFRDSAGASYVTGGGASVELAPGENTPLDLTVPLPPGQGLLLNLNLPPDPPVEQLLLPGQE